MLMRYAEIDINDPSTMLCSVIFGQRIEDSFVNSEAKLRIARPSVDPLFGLIKKITVRVLCTVIFLSLIKIIQCGDKFPNACLVSFLTAIVFL